MQTDENLEQNFTPEELEIIKEYIEWDNPEKNGSLVTLMGSSLEYSMLVSDNSCLYGTRLGTIFSNKVIYIDTNVIYYCLGINGNEYKTANELLLDKCRKARQSLKITQVTDTEFVNTLQHYIDEIKKFESGSLSRINYQRYMKDKDIYLFYLEWKKTKKKFNDPECFKKYIMTQYASWIKKFSVEIDYNQPYNLNNPEVSEIITSYSEQIPYKGSVNYDALNVYWIECLREKEHNRSFSDEKYFMLSPHRQLKKWDVNRDATIPIIIAPETWMILLTRFISRSEDDYKSFVNFINIKGTTDEIINNKEFFAIVKAIEETTEDLQQQETIIDALVEEKFAYLEKEQNEDITVEQVYDKTKQKAENMLSTRVNELTDEVGLLKGQVKQLQAEKDSQASLHTKEQKELVEIETGKMTNVYAEEQLLRKRVRHGMYIVIILALGIWQLVDFFVLKNSKNLFWTVTEMLLTKTPLEGEKTSLFVTWGGVIILMIIIPTIIWLMKIFFSENAIEKYKNKMKKKFAQKTNKSKMN